MMPRTLESSICPTSVCVLNVCLSLLIFHFGAFNELPLPYLTDEHGIPPPPPNRN